MSYQSPVLEIFSYLVYCSNINNINNNTYMTCMDITLYDIYSTWRILLKVDLFVCPFTCPLFLAFGHDVVSLPSNKHFYIPTTIRI